MTHVGRSFTDSLDLVLNGACCMPLGFSSPAGALSAAAAVLAGNPQEGATHSLLPLRVAGFLPPLKPRLLPAVGISFAAAKVTGPTGGFGWQMYLDKGAPKKLSLYHIQVRAHSWLFTDDVTMQPLAPTTSAPACRMPWPEHRGRRLSVPTAARMRRHGAGVGQCCSAPGSFYQTKFLPPSHLQPSLSVPTPLWLPRLLAGQRDRAGLPRDAVPPGYAVLYLLPHPVGHLCPKLQPPGPRVPVHVGFQEGGHPAGGVQRARRRVPF
jgi:hypothetical protein